MANCVEVYYCKSLRFAIPLNVCYVRLYHCVSEKYWTGTVALATYDSLRPPIRIRRTAFTGEGNLLPARWTLVNGKLAVTATYMWWSVTGDDDSTKMSRRIIVFSLWCDFMWWSSGYKQCELHNEQCKTSLGTTRCLNSEDPSVELYREVHGFLTQNTL